jgi:hypothetical protein
MSADVLGGEIAAKAWVRQIFASLTFGCEVLALAARILLY